ncbi:hypothetical protein SAMN05428949_7182 [Chitinophaga sp. YR627]|uniref:hypothetical protein n=1 Tax=Chitinophaga sp. YR627 TaxID=1881041 RepID=UPI0008E9A5DE|nr:hypothetical protein [Chitinophaga sp. YR627]SFP01538.1 hypothetical protein SAMN05428949_7182 [Chitinophaga sp. YR627]
MQPKKATAWKRNRKFGDIMGGCMRTKLDSGIFQRIHSLTAPTPGTELPIFIQDNPSKAFYYPLNIEEIKAILAMPPTAHTQPLTHIWLAKVRKVSYLSGEIPRGHFIHGSRVYLIKLYAVSKDNRLYFGRQKPDTKVLSFYAEHSTDLRKDGNGYYLQFNEVTVRMSYRKVLLHEIGHCADLVYKGGWSPANRRKTENFADDYATTWEKNQ